MSDLYLTLEPKSIKNTIYNVGVWSLGGFLLGAYFTNKELGTFTFEGGLVTGAIAGGGYYLVFGPSLLDIGKEVGNDIIKIVDEIVTPYLGPSHISVGSMDRLQAEWKATFNTPFNEIVETFDTLNNSTPDEKQRIPLYVIWLWAQEYYLKNHAFTHKYNISVMDAYKRFQATYPNDYQKATNPIFFDWMDQHYLNQYNISNDEVQAKFMQADPNNWQQAWELAKFTYFYTYNHQSDDPLGVNLNKWIMYTWIPRVYKTAPPPKPSDNDQVGSPPKRPPDVEVGGPNQKQRSYKRRRFI